MLLVSHLERLPCMANNKTACVQNAAFHLLWMIFPSQCNILKFLILILHLLFVKTRALHSYYIRENSGCTSLPAILSLLWATTLGTSKVDVPQNLCIYSIGPAQCVIILIILFYFFLPRLLFGQSGLILFSYFFNFSFTVVGWVFALVLLLVTLH